MKLAHPPGTHLTYCTNIHAGHTWPEVRANLATHVLDVKRAVAPERRFGVGLRLSGVAAAELGEPAALDELESFLDDNDLYVFTINGFPHGSFHATRVKEDVYRPDWLEDERLRYTDRLASILARLLPDEPGLDGTVSSVPLAYRARVAGDADVAAMVVRLVRHVEHLWKIREQTGKTIVLALEPEPCCYVETIAETVAFFESHVLGPTAITQLAGLTGRSPAQAEGLLRRHLGVCLDTCHAAVEFEHPEQAVAALRRAGIAVGKMQLSAGLRVAQIDEARAAGLVAFADDVYLHQVVERRADGLARYPDLPEAIAALGDASGAGPEWRIHFHVPLFLERLGELENTQPFLKEMLAIHAREPITSHLEVETYTWDVLPEAYRNEPVSRAVARELGWVLEHLTS